MQLKITSEISSRLPLKGKQLAKAIRSAVIHAKIVDKDTLRYTAYHLSRLGANLNQLNRCLNQGTTIDDFEIAWLTKEIAKTVIICKALLS